MSPITLKDYDTVSQLVAGETADVVGTALPEKIQERLAGLGLNMGARFTLVQGSRKYPFVLAVDETRVAIGLELADKIYVKKI